MATELIKVSELPVMADDFADGDLLIVSQYNGGSYISKSKNAFKLGLDSAAYDSTALWNVGLAASVSGNALTIALKQKDGATDPSSGVGRCRIGFRSGTITNGGFVTVDAVAATDTVISSGSTAGFTSAVEDKIFVYAIDNAGSVELAWSTSCLFDEGSLHTTTAEGGAGGADSRAVLYSTYARSNVMIRIIGYLVLTEATAGTWATGPAKIALWSNAEVPPKVIAEYNNMALAGGGTAPLQFNTKIRDTHNCVVTGGSWAFTAPVSQNYRVIMMYAGNPAATAYLYTNQSGSYVSRIIGGIVVGVIQSISDLVWLDAGKSLYFNTGATVSADANARVLIEGVGK